MSLLKETGFNVTPNIKIMTMKDERTGESGEKIDAKIILSGSNSLIKKKK